MAFELITSGGILDTEQLVSYENSIDEGQRARLELDLRWPAPAEAIDELRNRLKQAGVAEVAVSASSSLLTVDYRKGFPWLAIIVATILAAIVLAVLILGWRIFKEIVPQGLQPLVGTAGILVLIALGALVLFKVVKR